jgi:hypothetical protein
MEWLEHRPSTFWDTEEDDFTGLDTSTTTEGEIDEDVSVTFNYFRGRRVHREKRKDKREETRNLRI